MMIGNQDLSAASSLSHAGVVGKERASTGKKVPIVLVHGAWHGAWTYERVIPWLIAGGHYPVARDLPAHGLNARIPASYLRRPLDQFEFASERSPAADTTLDDYVDSVVKTIEQVRSLGHERVALVGHSMGGVPITAVAERFPEYISHLVYLTAFMPSSGVSAAAYVKVPENTGELVGAQLIGNPAETGALRMDHRSEDASYRENGKLAFYGDLSDDDYCAVVNLLTPDVPVVPFATPVVTTPERWGRIPRHYIMCLQDRAIQPALQRRFIREADCFVPGRPTVVHEMQTDHSPFMSQPKALAELLLQIVAS